MKKKVLSIVLALAMTIGIGTTVSAETPYVAGGSTVLSATIPADYEITVPESFDLEYGNSEKQLVATIRATSVNVTKITLLAIGAKYTDLINVADPNDTIALKIYRDEDLLDKETGTLSGGSMPVLFSNTEYDSHPYYYDVKFAAKVEEDAWLNATPGATYRATMNYIFRVDTD